MYLLHFWFKKFIQFIIRNITSISYIDWIIKFVLRGLRNHLYCEIQCHTERKKRRCKCPKLSGFYFMLPILIKYQMIFRALVTLLMLFLLIQSISNHSQRTHTVTTVQHQQQQCEKFAIGSGEIWNIKMKTPARDSSQHLLYNRFISWHR